MIVVHAADISQFWLFQRRRKTPTRRVPFQIDVRWSSYRTRIYIARNRLRRFVAMINVAVIFSLSDSSVRGRQTN